MVPVGVLGCILAYKLVAEFVVRREESMWRRQQSRPDADFRIRQSARTPSWTRWRDLVVTKILDESPDCRSFTLKPAGPFELPRFQGGQFLTLRLAEPGSPKKVTRCYSLSSAPGEPHYRITVKRVPGGRMSNLLHDTVQVGDRIEAKRPSGKFCLDEKRTDPLNLIAAGIGITPILSMLMHSLEVAPERPINVFYQLRDSRNAPFLGVLRKLDQTLARSGPHSNIHFRLAVWFSKPEHEKSRPASDRQTDRQTDRTGRIDARAVIQATGSTAGQFMICGPADFMSSIARGLVEHQVDPANVAYESFGGNSAAVDLAHPSANQQATGPVVDHQITLTQSGRTLSWRSMSRTDGDADGQVGSLLELAEANGIALESSCRSGNCGECLLRLAEGNVQYDQTPECDRTSDQVVMCVARPTSDLAIEV